ncbi:MAG: hypothetical protein ACTTHA_10430 [Treponema sp.]
MRHTIYAMQLSRIPIFLQYVVANGKRFNTAGIGGATNITVSDGAHAAKFIIQELRG